MTYNVSSGTLNPTHSPPVCNLRKVTTDEAQFTPGENSNAWIVVNLKRVSLWELYKEKEARSFWGKEL